MSTPVNNSPGRKTTTIGYVLWRGGLYFAGGYTLYEGSRWILDALLEIGVPEPILTGLALLLSGFTLLVASVVAEQIIDTRREGDLTDG